MPRNSSGVYTLPDGYLATTGQTILASQHNPPLEDLGVAITGSLPRNGTSGMLANLPMGGFKATNMADGVANSDSATVGQASALAVTAITTAATKTTPVDADTLPIVDSATSNTLKRITWASLKAFFQPASAILTALAGIGVAVAGDIIYATGAGVWGRLAKGTALQQVRMNAGATAPEWFTPSTSGLAKAWVNFNGTGTLAIRSSFNVSSVTDNGTGDYTINFTTPFSDGNYAAVCMAAKASGNNTGSVLINTQAASALNILTWDDDGDQRDNPTICVAVFGA